MKLGRIIFVFIFLGCFTEAKSQTDTITSRDTLEFVYLIKNFYIKDYQDLLIFIANSETGLNEVERIIENRVRGNSQTRIFYDENVIIDNDLNPGADTSKALRGEMRVDQYLKSFHTTYTKSEDPRIELSVQKVSSLNKKSYFYYNVLFTCNYMGTTAGRKTFYPFNRVAEIVLVKDVKWKLYIRAIRFPEEGDFDDVNVYKSIIPTDTDVEKLVRSINDEKENLLREENKQIQKLLYEGDDFFEEGKLDKAIAKYREARLVNVNNREALDKIDKTQKAILVLKQKEKEEAELKVKIGEMKAGAMQQYANYNFRISKVLCDSLIKDFKVQDPEVNKLSDQLSELNAALAGIETAFDRKDWKNAIKTCEQKIKEYADNISKAEFNYRMALAYYLSDKEETKKIQEYSTNAIELSGKRHQEALKLRAENYLNGEDITNAIEDASRLINNDSRNPENYVFRAHIYEKNNLFDKAIEDYKSAINYHSLDKNAFLNKAKLEYSQKKFEDVVKTCYAGLSVHSCFGLLYYYRGLSNDKLAMFTNTREDFRQARLCGVGPEEQKEMKQVSERYIQLGDVKRAAGSAKLAAEEYTIAITIDSSARALFQRGDCYLALARYQDALTDYVALSMINPKYPEVYGKMGFCLLRLKKYEEAIESFNKELLNAPSAASALYFKGQSEINLDRFAEATTSFEKAGTLQFSDSAFYYAALAAYKNRKYSSALALCEKAREDKTKMYQVYALSGKSYYALNNFSAAIKEFEKAASMNTTDEELILSYSYALEKNRKFEEAALQYERLSKSALYKDTVGFRSAICLAKAGGDKNLSRATQLFNRYLIVCSDSSKAEVYAWIAYCYLVGETPDVAGEFIQSSRSAGGNNAVLDFVMACKFSISKSLAEGMTHFENALASKYFSREDIENEKMLRNLGKSDRYKPLLEKYYPAK